MTQTSAIPGVAERPAPDTTLDTSGLLCPLPVYKASLALKELTAGQVLELVTTDPGSLADIPALARQRGDTLLDFEDRSTSQIFWIEKGARS
jgi:tRNA 2-thiouridine synthesizing protein A